MRRLLFVVGDLAIHEMSHGKQGATRITTNPNQGWNFLRKAFFGRAMESADFPAGKLMSETVGH